MYKLVPKKRKNIFLKILGFIVACAVIKELIVVLLGPAPVSQQLADFAESVNKRCPMVIDSFTTLNNCAAFSDYRLHFNYQFNSMYKEEVDTIALFLNSREQMINRIKTDPALGVFKKNDLSLTASFYDKTGNYICGVAVSPKDYNGN